MAYCGLKTNATPFAAVVLAGGRSTRMGCDKAGLPHPAGCSLLERQITLIDALSPAEKFLSLRDDQPDSPARPSDWRITRDTGEAGPLGGIVAALEACTAPRLLVLAVDLPAMDAPTLRNLLAFPSPGGVVPRGDEGYEPLAAVYSRAWLPAAATAMAAGRFALQRLLDDAVATGTFAVVPAVPGPIWSNWNEPDDLPTPPPTPPS